MDIKLLIDKLFGDKKNSRSGLLFETLIVELMKNYLFLQKKSLITHHKQIDSKLNGYLVYDGYVQGGFDDYVGDTVLEIKAYNNIYSILNLENSLKKLILNIDNTKIKNIIIILPFDLTQIEKEKVLHTFNNFHDIKMEFWGPLKLQKILNKYPKNRLKSLENIPEIFLTNQINTSVKQSHEILNNENNEEYISCLNKFFKEDDLVLFLGSGISKDAKIPTWDNLISDLLVSLISNKLEEQSVIISDTEKKFIIEELKKSNGNSPLLLARYIRHGLKDVFEETLSKILYKNSIDTSEILTSITKLCKPVRSKIGVRGIINYNFDDLLERNFLLNDISHRSIYIEGDISSKNELGLYHVHGFLPQSLESYSHLDKKLLVFSEEGYHNLMLDPYNWANLTQLKFLTENTCLFIGLSLTDPNLRRLLDIASRKYNDLSPEHYAILKRESYYKTSKEQNGLNPNNIKTFDSINSRLQEEYYKEFRINIIWVNDYKEIPAILNRIKV